MFYSCLCTAIYTHGARNLAYPETAAELLYHRPNFTDSVYTPWRAESSIRYPESFTTQNFTDSVLYTTELEFAQG